MTNKKRVVVDLEANGLLDTADKIWCAGFVDVDTQEVKVLLGQQEICQELDTINVLIAHNGIAYDLPLLKKVYEYEFKGEIVDTLIASRVLWPDRPGGHSVDAWAKSFGSYKVTNEDWENFSPVIIERCEQDIKIQLRIYKQLLEELKASERFDRLGYNYERLEDNGFIMLEQAVQAISEKQAAHGVVLNIKSCEACLLILDKKIQMIDEELAPMMPMRRVEAPMLKKPRRIDGSYSEAAASWLEQGGEMEIHEDGSATRWVYKPVDLNSSSQLKEYLLSIGWEPTEFNYKKEKDKYGKMRFARDKEKRLIPLSPKLPKDDNELEALCRRHSNPSFKLVANRLQARHRLTAIQGYLDRVRVDGRIESKVITCGTNTARMTHIGVANVPRTSSFFGKEMRSLFTVPEGRAMVGADASRLEFRCLAHYLNDPEFTDFVCNHDIKSYFHNILQDYVSGGDLAKAVVYAMIYGASNKKLGTLSDLKSGNNQNIGGKMRALLEENIPNLQSLVDRCKKAHEQLKCFQGIDGRTIFTRSAHSALNTLLQSTGAIIMKYATKLAAERLEFLNVDATIIIQYHDELQVECNKSDATLVGNILVQSMQQAGEHLQLNLPIDGEFQVGTNWSETH